MKQLLILLSLILGIYTNTYAQWGTAHWTGNNSSDWADSGNWSGTLYYLALFDGGFSNQPELNESQVIPPIEVAETDNGVTFGGLLMTLNNYLGNFTVDSNTTYPVTIDTPIKFNCGSYCGAGFTFTNDSDQPLTINSDFIHTNFDTKVTVTGSGDTYFAGDIEAMVGFTKSGSGNLTFEGDNSTQCLSRTWLYAPVVFNGGTTFINTQMEPNWTNGGNYYTVNSGATLAGNGDTQNSVTVNSGGNLSPGEGGNTTAILKVGMTSGGAGLTLNEGSNLLIDINGTTVGDDYDQVDCSTGTPVTIDNANLVVTVGSGANLSVNQTFEIIKKRLSGAISGTFYGLSQNSTFTANGYSFSISYTGGTNGNSVVLTVTQTP